ncbi:MULTISPECIES: phosphotransferase [unclassified Microcoleus]|uniref:phosphotransferase n=1 Tax=unclassified Microcoleus TaxID=2642155 RepID=UPI002FD1238A
MKQLFKASIPEAKLEAVERALKTAFNTAIAESVELLSGGLSSALVYKITVNGKIYILKVILQTDTFNDPNRHYICMNLAAEAGVAPHVYYASAEDAISITDFIEAQPFPRQFTPDNLIKVVSVVRAIHAAPNFPTLVNYLDGIDGFIENFKASKLLPESATEEHFRYYAEIQKAYPRYDPDLVPSHNDLHHRNLLFDGQKIWVVDWEAAFQNDRYVDLAIVANNFVKTEAQEEIYLKAYFGDSLDEYKRARFFIMQQVCLMCYAMLFMRFATVLQSQDTVIDECMETVRQQEFFTQIAKGTVSLSSPEGQFLYAKVLLNEALYNMKTPRFAEAIDRMNA